jgi:hypothetical protein
MCESPILFSALSIFLDVVDTCSQLAYRMGALERGDR